MNASAHQQPEPLHLPTHRMAVRELLADALRQTPSGAIALTPSNASKPQRGLALLAQSAQS